MFKVELENVKDTEEILKIKDSYVDGIKNGKTTVMIPYTDNDKSTIQDIIKSYNVV